MVTGLNRRHIGRETGGWRQQTEDYRKNSTNKEIGQIGQKKNRTNRTNKGIGRIGQRNGGKQKNGSIGGLE